MAFRNPSTHFVRTIQFTKTDLKFLDSIKPWGKDHWSASFGTPKKNSLRNKIKVKIKKQLAAIQDNYCGFCGIDLRLVYKTHREHIAPQYKHHHYMFEPENLVLSCNFCNEFKGKKLTVTKDTKDYATTTFKILHPYRDDFSTYLSCDYKNRELIFTIVGPDPIKTQQTIDCIGLNEPLLMRQRGALIFMDSMPIIPNEDATVRQIVKDNRKGA